MSKVGDRMTDAEILYARGVKILNELNKTAKANPNLSFKEAFTMAMEIVTSYQDAIHAYHDVFRELRDLADKKAQVEEPQDPSAPKKPLLN